MELISAVATAQGAGGVAIVRISGDGARELAQKMFSRKLKTPNLLTFGKIDCGEFFDLGMCVFFQAPHSFTGEDVVEFHCHGGIEIARGVLRRTISLGARAAESGEFTKRAYLNGKLSLSAVEGLGEMISAESSSQVRAGYLLYIETLTKEAEKIRAEIKNLLALCEADADFPEEDLFSDVSKAVLTKTKAPLLRLDELLSQAQPGRKIKSGVSVAIFGRPNAGKSSLLNALLGFERAIVSPVPGTTRDFLEGTIELHGVRFRLIDTAGFRESADDLEKEGIKRTEQILRSSDLIVYLKEEGDSFSFPEGISVITAGAKCDLKREGERDVFFSSKTGEGIERLKELIYSLGFGKENDGAFLLEERQIQALKEAREELFSAQKGAREGILSELLIEHLRRAYFALGRISGKSCSEEVIEEIFSHFCVGK